jgi:single-stranded DNA-binding protein
VKTLANEIMGKANPPTEEKESAPKPLTSGMPGKTAQTRSRSAPKAVEPDPEDFADDDIPF